MITMLQRCLLALLLCGAWHASARVSIAVIDLCSGLVPSVLLLGPCTVLHGACFRPGICSIDSCVPFSCPMRCLQYRPVMLLLLLLLKQGE